MQRIAALWNKGFVGQVTIILVGLVMVCCVFGAIFRRSASRGPQETANAFATITTGLATREAANAPTPTATLEPTISLPPLAYANVHPHDPEALKRAIYLELFLRNFDIEDQGEALPERLKHLDELRGLGLLSEAEYAERRQFIIERGYRT